MLIVVDMSPNCIFKEKGKDVTQLIGGRGCSHSLLLVAGTCQVDISNGAFDSK